MMSLMERGINRLLFFFSFFLFSFFLYFFLSFCRDTVLILATDINYEHLNQEAAPAGI